MSVVRFDTTEKKVEYELKEHWKQCDQMVRLFFNIWQFATLKISPIMSQICQSGSVFCQIRNKLSKFAKGLYFFAKVAKFRQIWLEGPKRKKT